MTELPPNSNWVAITNHLTIPEAMLYLEMYMNFSPQMTIDAWRSFGITIGAANVAVSFGDLYNRIANEGAIDMYVAQAAGTQVATVADELWMAMYIASIYRVCSIQRDEYRIRVCNAITDRLKTQNAPQTVDMLVAFTTYKAWPNNKWF